MRKQALLLLTMMSLIGCSRADVETLGRIGQRVGQRIDALAAAEPNRSMIRTLPMLQTPKPAEMKDAAEPRTTPPRLDID